MDMSLSTNETVLIEEGQESGESTSWLGVAGRKAIRAGVCLVTDKEPSGKGYRGQ